MFCTGLKKDEEKANSRVTKSPVACAKSPLVGPKSPLLSAKTPVGSPKSPTNAPKSPVGTPKSPAGGAAIILDNLKSQLVELDYLGEPSTALPDTYVRYPFAGNSSSILSYYLVINYASSVGRSHRKDEECWTLFVKYLGYVNYKIRLSKTDLFCVGISLYGLRHYFK